ncbi:medium-chain acyl-CoA ligase ACSF2, mitochondrial-like [Ruditapes philippinarum]|uniref:medium-chain acyl-CoA ligase ACSF2, mitochondrial-like n=1 Tax=Ruditapes philippinarum TaxID=129788 RepID=UPI00295A748E|nr:medium-chain acyl-CoA ligase ACSF2, mitochondrial-like [Ruditapes philippinarum]
MEIKKPSYIHRPTGFQYNYQTVPERLLYMAQKCGDKEVYVFLHPDGRRDSINARELYQRSRQLAYSLMSLGIGAGDIVATCLDNELDLLICTFATICTGAIILNVVMRNEDGSDLKQKLCKLDVKCLIVNPGKDRQRFTACLNFITKLSPDGLVESESVPSLKIFISTTFVEERQLKQLNDLYKDPGNSFHFPRLDPEMTVVLLPTSGSTGESKFVAHSHHDVMIIGNHLKESFGYDSGDVIYNERRFAWIGGFPFMYLHDGVKVVTKTQPFESLQEHCEFTYNAMLQEKCTVAGLFPATIIGLLDKINGMTSPSKLFVKKKPPWVVLCTCLMKLRRFRKKVTSFWLYRKQGFAHLICEK